MRNKLLIIILLLAIGCQSIVLASDWGVEHENVLSVRYGGMWMQDQYLSPLLYSGQQVGLSNEWWQHFRNSQTKFSSGNIERYSYRLMNPVYRTNWVQTGRLSVNYNWIYNQVMTNLIYSLGISGGWGVCHNWLFVKNKLHVKLGPYIDVDLMGKMHGSNVNKPYSMDLAVNLCAMGGLEWAFRAKKTSYRLRYLVRANVVGLDYLPDYWHSYYEMGEGVLGDFRCSGMWNHRHLQHELTFDMQLKRSTWRVGITHEYLEYGKKGMMFSREMVSAVVGCVWQYRVKGVMRNFEL
jgi:hypothetical protein